jgi:galactokinase
MTGGGFGGSIVALARADEAQGLAEAVVTAYGNRGETPARAYICCASDGARRLS